VFTVPYPSYRRNKRWRLAQQDPPQPSRHLRPLVMSSSVQACQGGQLLGSLVGSCRRRISWSRSLLSSSIIFTFLTFFESNLRSLWHGTDGQSDIAKARHPPRSLKRRSNTSTAICRSFFAQVRPLSLELKSTPFNTPSTQQPHHDSRWLRAITRSL
jgi:hypothetical protein